MSIRKYFKQQFQLKKFLLQHEVTSDFYLCCFLKNRSATPLLIVRTILFVGCLSITISSMVLTTYIMPLEYWPLYMTHWGLLLNTIASGFGLLVSIMAKVTTSIDTNSGLPWYAQSYWATFSMATTTAFFITIFYWSLLYRLVQDFAFDFTLDVFIHAVNSVLMFALLVSSRQPSHLLHFYIPIGLAIVYLIFTYIYFVAGGTDAFGLHTIYPMIDWEKPGQTMGIAAICTIGITILHGVVITITALRDFVTRPLRKDSSAYDMQKVY